MFEIILYSTESPINAIDKVLTNRTVFNSIANSDLNVTNPVIRLTGQNFTGFNYAYIPSFERYYFIDSIECERNTYTYLRLSVDVLMSYKDAILELYGFVNSGSKNNPFASNFISTNDVRTNIEKLEFENGQQFNKQGINILVAVRGS